jgi:hypothetical protein
VFFFFGGGGGERSPPPNKARAPPKLIYTFFPRHDELRIWQLAHDVWEKNNITIDDREEKIPRVGIDGSSLLLLTLVARYHIPTTSTTFCQ